MPRTSDAHGGASSGTAPRLYARAERILADDILSGRLAVGVRLLESQLAQRFGISRAPVRQALGALEAAGLLGRGDGRGYIVLADAAGLRASDPTARRAAETKVEDGPLAAAASWERIYGEVETAIVSRTAFTTLRVIESELARAYDVSRTVARDVVARLNQRGIVRKDARGRWIAPELTPAHVANLYEMRWVVEPAALINAYPVIPKPMVAGALAHIEAAIARGAELDGAALDALESELHRDLLGFCRNQTMLDVMRHCQSLLVAHSFLYDMMPQIYGVEPFLSEHQAILERLAGGYVRAAAQALEQHLRVSLDRAIDRIAVVGRRVTPTPLAYLLPVDAPTR